MAQYQQFVGVDVAAQTFTASWQSAQHPSPTAARTFAQTSEGFTAFQHQLEATGVPADQTLIVLEATGSYWVALAVAMHAVDYAVSVVNPAHVHRWAESLPRRAKTDALDAQLLARYAAERQPAPWTPPPLVYHELRQRLVVRDGLLTMRQQARNQRHALQHWPITIAAASAALDAVIAEVDQQLATLEREIDRILADGAWAESAQLLATISGIGLITSAWLLVGTINFTRCASAAAAAAYVGLVPLARQSGTSVRRRAQIGHAGNGRVRTALYMATLSAAQHNPVIRAQYARLRASGKPGKVARCAAARKLLQIAYAVVTKRQPFDPAYAR
jgi:transposase